MIFPLSLYCMSVCRPCVEFLREEVVVLLTAQFITLFNQTALEVRDTTVGIHLHRFSNFSHNVRVS